MRDKNTMQTHWFIQSPQSASTYIESAYYMRHSHWYVAVREEQ